MNVNYFTLLGLLLPSNPAMANGVIHGELILSLCFELVKRWAYPGGRGLIRGEIRYILLNNNKRGKLTFLSPF